MNKNNALQLTSELFDKTTKIKLNSPAGVFGTTSGQSLLQNLQKSIADLSKSVSSDESYEVIMQKYELVASSIDTAAVTGMIAESEASDYYKLIDDIWAQIEQNK